MKFAIAQGRPFDICTVGLLSTKAQLRLVRKRSQHSNSKTKITSRSKNLLPRGEAEVVYSRNDEDVRFAPSIDVRDSGRTLPSVSDALRLSTVNEKAGKSPKSIPQSRRFTTKPRGVGYDRQATTNNSIHPPPHTCCSDVASTPALLPWPYPVLPSIWGRPEWYNPAQIPDHMWSRCYHRMCECQMNQQYGHRACPHGPPPGYYNPDYHMPEPPSTSVESRVIESQSSTAIAPNRDNQRSFQIPQYSGSEDAQEQLITILPPHFPSQRVSTQNTAVENVTASTASSVAPVVHRTEKETQIPDENLQGLGPLHLVQQMEKMFTNSEDHVQSTHTSSVLPVSDVPLPSSESAMDTVPTEPQAATAEGEPKSWQMELETIDEQAEEELQKQARNRLNGADTKKKKE